MRRVVLFATSAWIAGIAMWSSAGSSRPEPSSQPDRRPGGIPSIDAERQSAHSKPPQLNLDTLRLVNGHYEAAVVDGRRAILTLDPALQKTAEHLLTQARAPFGAIVAMAPDGRILALSGRRGASRKGGRDGSFDWRLATEIWAPAASIFKLVTASALVAGGVDPDRKIRYHGGLRSVIESNLTDSKRDNSSEDLAYAIAHSNNAIIGKLAYKHLEPRELAKIASDLTSPLPFVVDATFAEFALPRNKNLEFARAAAGFSGSRLSVLGGAVLAATFAEQGAQPVPRLIARLDGGEELPLQAARRVLPPSIARAVGRMMVATCDTGSAAKSFRQRGKRGLEVAGKTGTLATTSPYYIEHSWFVGYAPADDPQVIVSVLLGNPARWHLRGHQAARRLIDRALSAPRSSDQTGERPRGVR